MIGQAMSDRRWQATTHRAAIGAARRIPAHVAVMAALLALLFSGEAEAATTHNFSSRVTEGAPGTPLKEPGVCTVERSSGRVFMADRAAGVIDVFSAAGAFVSQFGEGLEPRGVAVDEATGDVYVSSANTIVVYRPNGAGGYDLLSEWEGTNTPLREFGELEGVGVDNSKGSNAGDIYVLDSSNNTVELFKPKPPGPEEGSEGAFLSTLSGAKFEEPDAIALDASTGNVYVADSSKGFVAIYGPSGTFESKLTGAGSPQGSFKGAQGEEGNVSALAAEAGTLYVAEAERHVVSQFNAAGEWSGWVTGTPAPFSEPDGVAVDPSGDLYVADALTEQLDLFGPPVIVPDAQTSPASKIKKTTAFLNGIVDGEGKAAKYHFEYGTTEAYGSLTPTGSSGVGEEKITAELTGLQAGASYHFRLVTENENGTNIGADQQFETLRAVEGLSTGPVQDIQPSEATLTGTLSPNGTDAHYAFEWGATVSYGQSTPSTDAGSVKESVAAKTTLVGLTPNTTYHYRLVGSNSFGQTQGTDGHFTTSGPPQITPQLTSGITHEAAALNARLDPGELETTYRFQYGTTPAYGSETAASKLAPGETFQAVSASLTGLQIGTVYHFRLVAENTAGKIMEPDQVFETVPPAPIEGTSALAVSATAASFQAEVNPLGRDTTYYLQYGTAPCAPEPAACSDVPAAPGQDIGSGEESVPVGQAVAALNPSTTYHYRFVAINSLGTSRGPERTISTQPAKAPSSLADSRAWEMVTPPNKHGAPIEALTDEGGLILASEDGNSITYVANGSIAEEPEGQRSPEMQQDISARTREGWTTQDIATPNTRAQGVSAGQAAEYQYFTPDLSHALVEPWGDSALSEPPLAPEAKQKTVYIRDNAAGSYLPLVTEGNVARGTEFGHRLRFLSATPDLGHVLLHSEVALAPPPSGPGLYEWTAGKVQFVSLLPNGTIPPETALGYSHLAANAISRGGTRILWTNSAERPGHLYLRDTAIGQTLQVDAAQGVAEPATGSARFQTASANGSKVFFTDVQKLTADSTAQPTFPEKADLYDCEVVEEGAKLGCHLKDLTLDRNPGEHAAVQGLLLGASEDGSSIYFVAQGALTGNENGNGERGEAGRNNLYELQLSGTYSSITFIAQLSSEDNPEWEGNRQADTAFLTARVSSSGRYLAFMSNASPTGYDNRDATSGKRDEEVYLYDSQETRLTCVSCNPSGARPHGVLDTIEAGEGLGLVVDRRKVWAESGHEHWLAGNIPGWTAQSLPPPGEPGALFQSRYLNDEGRLFFNSPDHLVPQAESGKEAVYEYEPLGLGSCQSPSGGCVSLLSSGSSDRESAFLEATPSGNDVFFLTATQLLPEDTDTAFDIYDARVCTPASPCLTQPTEAPPGCTTANACRPSESGQQPPLGVSGSATVTGQGNLPPQPLRTGQPRGTKALDHPKPLTRAEQLAKALKACKKVRSSKKRKRCEAQARRKWATKATAKKTSRQARRGRR